MSRRRKFSPLPVGQYRTFVIAVVCTDRDQHPEAAIGDLSGAPLTGQDPANVWHLTRHGQPAEDWMGGDGWRTQTLKCRRCGRDVPLREPKVMVAIAKLAKSGIGDGRPVLDISLC